MSTMRRLITALSVLALPAQQPAIAPPHTGLRRVHFVTHRGSWLSFDISHDHRSIAIDLLGQLWLLPVRGGVAKPVTDVVRDSADFIDPVFSPDDQSVVSHGEFRGQLGSFLVGVKQTGVRWIAPDTLTGEHGHRLLYSPSWASDTHLLLTRLDPNGPPRLIDRDIRSGVERTIDIRGVDDPGLDQPTYSVDKTEIFFSTVRPWDAHATFPRGGRIWRVPAAGGEARPVTPSNVRMRGVAPSPDATNIAYFVIDSASHVQIWLQNLSDASAEQLTRDADVTPTRLHWLSRDTLVYVESGRLWRLDVRTRRRAEIPFSATVDFVRKTPVLPAVDLPVAGKQAVMHATSGFAISADGKSLVAIGRNVLWVAPAEPGAQSRTLVHVPADAAEPYWSPNGREVVWQAGAMGKRSLFVTDTATRQTRRLNTMRGDPGSPAWSPDGRLIAFRAVAFDSARRLVRKLVAMSAADSLASPIDLHVDPGPQSNGKPEWSPHGDAILVLGPRDDNLGERAGSVAFLDGSEPRRVHGLRYDASSVRWLSGDTLVFLAAVRLWRASFDVVRGMVGPATPISDEPAAFLESSKRGDLLYVSEDGFRIRPPTSSPRRIGWPDKYTMPTPPPLLIHNVRIIDGTGAPPSLPKDILIERGRIARISPAGSTATIRNTEVLDAGGRTAIPGLIDLHSHNWLPAQFRGLLYYGVTTVRNVGCDASAPDALVTGDWPGPRMVAALQINTDEPFNAGGCSSRAIGFGSAGLWPEADAQHLERAARLIPALGSGLVKIHSASGWAGHVRTVTAAHARGVHVTGHCAFPLTVMAAGMNSKEHLGWQCSMHEVGAWYDDLVQLYANAGVPIVPTLALFVTSDRQQGAPAPVPAEVAAMFSDMERAQIARSLNFRSLTPENTLDLGYLMDAARKLHRAGVVLGAGTDFERPDALQYELEALVEASLTPLEAIAAATSHAASIIGASADIGRIAPGLFGDIVILDGDPTNDIRNTRRVWSVVQGGSVVDRRRLATAP